MAFIGAYSNPNRMTLLPSMSPLSPGHWGEFSTCSEQRRVSGFTVAQVQQFMDGLAALMIPVIPYFLWRPTLRDPDDEMVLDASMNGQANAIVTFNVRHFLPAAKQFQLDVLTPAQALRRL